MTTPEAPKYHDALERRTLAHGEQGESADELEVIALRNQLREAQAERDALLSQRDMLLTTAKHSTPNGRVNDLMAEQASAWVKERAKWEAARNDWERNSFEWQARAESAEGALNFHRFRRCDIAACNCGSWHAPPNERAERTEAEVERLKGERKESVIAEATAIADIAASHLVRAEREACAKLADTLDAALGMNVADTIAAAIRARACVVDPILSRSCELGTKSCGVKHGGGK